MHNALDMVELFRHPFRIGQEVGPNILTKFQDLRKNIDPFYYAMVSS